MTRRPPRFTRTDTPFPDTTLVRSAAKLPTPPLPRGDTLTWNLASVWESVADAVGDRVALVHGDRRTTWREFDDRSARLAAALRAAGLGRSEEHTSELQSLMRISYAVFCLKQTTPTETPTRQT